MSAHSSWALSLQGAVDPRVVATPAPLGTLYQNLATGQVFSKVGGSDTAWGLIAGNTQSFIYTFTGLEVGFGTQNVQVPLLHAMPDMNFQSIVTDGGRADLAQVFYTAPFTQNVSPSIITTICTAIPQVGDKITVFVASLQS